MRPPPPAPSEQDGQAVVVLGLLRELYDDGTALVDFPATGGAQLGVRLKPDKPGQVGDWVPVTVTVAAGGAKHDTLTVTVPCVEKDVLQAVDLERARLQLAS